MTSKNKPILLSASVSLALMLSACGGGGSSDSSTPVTPPTPPVPPSGNSALVPTDANAQATLTALGATLVDTTANQETFFVVADIGDTWKIAINASNGSYQITPINSMFGLAPVSGTLVRSLANGTITYTLQGQIALTFDQATSSLFGTVTLGGKATSVVGTPYQLGKPAGLAGVYDFLGAARNAANGQVPELMAGQLRVNAAGTGATLCIGGAATADNVCQVVDSGTLPEKHTLTFTAAQNGAFYTVQADGNTFGNLTVVLGDRGPALVMDRYGKNNEGVVRVGTFMAAPAKKLAGTELNGTWTCGVQGNTLGTLTASATSAALTLSNQTGSGLLNFNAVNSSNGQLLSLDGFVSLVVGGNQAGAQLVLPMSKNLMVMEAPSGYALETCRRA
ncbi:hypothetical protein KSF73_07865 [Burkholderiaceae bacterium DAT-1]|nr:hypothetical protein [Burkholderiaceae bacterium DAT-1]